MTALKRKRAPGGGRKPIAQGGTVRKTLTLLVDDLAYLNTIDANTSKAVRQLVREHRESTSAVNGSLSLFGVMQLNITGINMNYLEFCRIAECDKSELVEMPGVEPGSNV